jgi:hypothetical protein
MILANKNIVKLGRWLFAMILIPVVVISVELWLTRHFDVLAKTWTLWDYAGGFICNCRSLLSLAVTHKSPEACFIGCSFCAT